MFAAATNLPTRAAELFLVRTTSSQTARCLYHDCNTNHHHIAGLAAFSRNLDKDPWTLEKNVGGQLLCANLVGGTEKYFSPEQHWLLSEIRKLSGEELRAFEDQWMITPATSDLFQATITMTEAHARYLPFVSIDAKSVARDAVARCAARTPESELSKHSPEQLGDWLAEKKIEPSLESVVVEKGVDGLRLVELARSSSHKELQKEFGLKIAVAKKMQDAIRRNISTPADAMAHEMIGKVLYKCLDPDVCERCAAAEDVLRGLGAKRGRDKTTKKWGVDVTKAVGGNLLVPPALEIFPDHSDAIVDGTLGGLTKRLVEYGDVQGALDSCAEWMGVASDDARPGAFSLYCKLWKEFGGELHALRLAMGGHGHWRKEMLSGEAVMHDLAVSLSFCAASSLKMIDLSMQVGLEGHVLEILFEGASVLPKLQTLKLEGCGKAAGSIPAAIGGCKSLTALDLSECQFSGAAAFVLTARGGLLACMFRSTCIVLLLIVN